MSLKFNFIVYGTHLIFQDVSRRCITQGEADNVKNGLEAAGYRAKIEIIGIKFIWRIKLDQYGDESIAKSGSLYSIVETCDILIEKYNRRAIKPELEVIDIGLGIALSDMLEDRKIPFKRVAGSHMRIGSADVLETKV